MFRIPSIFLSVISMIWMLTKCSTSALTHADRTEVSNDKKQSSSYVNFDGIKMHEGKALLPAITL
jgi:hypothetical protein